jgi:ParB family chromosome partitioning protein
MLDVHEQLAQEAEDVRHGAAWTQVQAERKAWAEQLPEQETDILPWVLQQNNATVVRLLTFLIACSITGVHSTEQKQQCNDGVARALGLDMTKWWKVTGPSYLDHVSKARIAEVLEEAGQGDTARALDSLSKSALVAGAEQALEPTGWLPPVLRLRPPAEPMAKGGADREAEATPEQDEADEGVKRPELQAAPEALDVDTEAEAANDTVPERIAA